MYLLRTIEARLCNNYCSGKNNKSYIVCVSVCSLSYPACIAHTPQCHLWPVQLYLIFLHYLINDKIVENTGLFISSSGISELDCATTKTDTAERIISIGRESLQVFFVLGALAYFQVPPLRGSREEKLRSQ